MTYLHLSCIIYRQMEDIIVDQTRMIIWYVLSFSCLLITYPAILYAKYLHQIKNYDKRDKYANIILAFICRVFFYLSGSRVTITGKENIPKDKAVIFVSNHQGHLDGVIIQGFIKKSKGFVSIKEIGQFPILGSWMKYVDSVFVDRENTRQTLLSMDQAVDNLNRGQSMVVFPEGKLNDGAQTFNFERGWLRMVTNNGVPIVPITIKNSYKIISYNGKAIHSARVECIISKPIETFGLKRGDEKAFLSSLRATIMAHI